MSTPAALQRRRDYAGPALFAYGFRPFFLAAGLWAAFGILLWLPQYLGLMTLPTAFGPLDWHIHEMLYGYVAASVAGFLLTAIPNWTGRLPVSGWPLAGLVALWLAGRIAILCSAKIGGLAAAVIDVSFLVTLAAVALLRQHLPELRMRVVNVVDLMALQPHAVHPHGLTDRAFDGMFTGDRPVIFTYHGYPYLIHRLTYRRRNHDNMHVHGFREEGTTTTPFDMTVLNEIDRFHLAMDAIARVPGLPSRAVHVTQRFQDKLIEHAEYVRRYGEDMPEIRNWSWAGGGTTQAHDRK